VYGLILQAATAHLTLLGAWTWDVVSGDGSDVDVCVESMDVSPSLLHSVSPAVDFSEIGSGERLSAKSIDAAEQTDAAVCSTDRNNPHVCENNDIKVEYHLHSGQKMQFFHFEDYIQEHSESGPINSKLWYPFSCCDDFEFADTLLKSRMKCPQIETVLDIIHHFCAGKSDFLFHTVL
jgi:hypothetical protein